MADSYMSSMIIVVIYEFLNSSVESAPVFLWHDVNILVFYRFPTSFDPNVVLSPAAAVHADPHLRMLSVCVNPRLACKLATLIKVYDFRCAIRSNSILEHIYAVWGIQRVVQTPAYNATTVNTNYRGQVHECFLHRNIYVISMHQIWLRWSTSMPLSKYDLMMRFRDCSDASDVTLALCP